jgi:hypothetical protein
MPKFQLVKEDKIIGWDDKTNEVFIYKPQVTTLVSLTEEELHDLIEVVRHHPQGGSMTVDEIRQEEQSTK